jgi:hypothetical protein
VANVADYLIPREAAHKVLIWFGYHVAVYAGIAMAAGVAFLVGAGAYSYLWPPDVISIETQSPAADPATNDVAPVVPNHPLKPEDALVAGVTNPFATGNLIGLDVWDVNRDRVGKITDLVLDRRGNAQGIIVGLSGYWLTKKYVVIPFKEFTWDYQASDENPKALVIERGIVPYRREHLQGLPPIGDPWVPLGHGDPSR